MAIEKPGVDSGKLRDSMQEREHARGAEKQEVQYRAVMEQLTEGINKLENQIRDSRYESLPSGKELDTLLSLVMRAEQLLPEGHPTREQFAIQERTALEIAENVKKAKKYLAALEHAREDARQLRTLIESKEGMSQMLQGEAGMSDADKELRAQAREAAESEIQKAVEAFTKPIFGTLPKDHPLRRKHAKQEQEIEDILWPERHAAREKAQAERKRREELAKTNLDMPIPEDIDYAKNPPLLQENAGVDLYEEIGKGAGLEPVAKTPRERRETGESRNPENRETQEYRRQIANISSAVSSLTAEFEKAAARGNLDAVETAMGQTMNLSYDLQRLRNQKPAGLEDGKGEELERTINDLGVRIEKEARKIRERGGANAAFMPRIPAAPYRMRYTNAGRRGATATLAVAPAPASVPGVHTRARPMPPVPDGIDAKSDDEKLAYLEDLLKAFQTEHARLVDEHNMLVNKLTEQVKERKLQALRESLKT